MSNELSNHLARISINMRNAINRDVPLVAGNEAARLFRQNFQNEGFFGKKWQEVKRRRNPKVKGADAYRKILTGRTGDLGRSLRVRTEPGVAIIYSDVKYSRAHNDGTRNAGRGRRTRIPQRQFIGDHPVLEKAIREKIEITLNNLFK